MSGSFIWKWTKDRVRKPSEGCDHFRGSESSESLERTACISGSVFAFQTPKSPYEMLTMRSYVPTVPTVPTVFFFSLEMAEKSRPRLADLKRTQIPPLNILHEVPPPLVLNYRHRYFRLSQEGRVPMSLTKQLCFTRGFIFIFQNLIFPEAFRKCCAVTLHRQVFLVPTAPS